MSDYLIAEIQRLNEQRDRWRTRAAALRRSRDMWRNRALEAWRVPSALEKYEALRVEEARRRCPETGS